MKKIETSLPDVILFEPKVISDNRGFFFESFNQEVFNKTVGKEYQFIQDNHSSSHKNVLRGLHYQIKKAQGKLIRTIEGEIFDVAVDLRGSSPTFLQWTGEILSDENKRMMWIPPGFAHGFLVLSETAYITYKVSDNYAPEYERTLAWNDETIGINWPGDLTKIITSDKDKSGIPLDHAETFE